MAPIAEPVKGIGKWAKKMIGSDYPGGFADAADPGRSDFGKPYLFRLYHAWHNREDSGVATRAGLLLGPVLGVLGVGFTAGASAGLPLILAGGLAGLAAGAAAAPFVFMAVLALAGAAAGGLEAPWAFAKGVAAAARHFKSQKHPAPQKENAAQAVMPVMKPSAAPLPSFDPQKEPTSLAEKISASFAAAAGGSSTAEAATPSVSGTSQQRVGKNPMPPGEQDREFDKTWRRLFLGTGLIPP
jgi:hypothetical protein